MNRKVAIIVVLLVLESKMVAKEQIEKEIREDSTIPWCKEIEKVAVLKIHG